MPKPFRYIVEEPKFYYYFNNLCILLESQGFKGFKLQVSATITPQITAYFSKTHSANTIKVIALCVFAIIAITCLAAILTNRQLPKPTTTPLGATKRVEEPPIIKFKALTDSSIVENSTPPPNLDAQKEDDHRQYHDLSDAIKHRAPDSVLQSLLTNRQPSTPTTIPSGITKSTEGSPIGKDKALTDSSIVENSTPPPSPDAQTEDIHQQYHDLADAIKHRAPDGALQWFINRGYKPCNLHNGNTLTNAINAKAGYSTIKLLIDNGAEPSNFEGETLNAAIKQNAPLEVLQLLINNGVKPDNGKNKNTNTLRVADLNLTNKKPIIEFLLNNTDIKVNSYDLHWYIKYKASKTLLQLLFNNGVIIHNANGFLNTLLGAVEYKASVEILQLLFDNDAVIDNSDSVSNTLLGAIHHKASAQILQMLFEKGAVIDNSDSGSNTLLGAVEYKASLETLQLLFDNGAVIDNSDSGSNTLLGALKYKASVQILQMLFEKGAVVDNSDLGSNTLLGALKHKASAEILQLLFEKGAVIDNSDSVSNTLLTALEYRAPTEVLQQLVNHQAEINTGDGPFNTLSKAFTYYINDNVVKWLLNNGATPSSSESNNTLSIAVENSVSGTALNWLIENGAEPSNSILRTRNTLYRAIEANMDDNRLQLLIDHGAKPTCNAILNLAIKKHVS